MSRDERRRRAREARKMQKRARNARAAQSRKNYANRGGYNVPMIVDFHEHLLTELRAQHYELMKQLHAIENSGEEPMKLSVELIQKFRKFIPKYKCAMLYDSGFDTENASADEVRAIKKAVIESLIAQRDIELGHLESLRPLLKETTECIILSQSGGQVVCPVKLINVRKACDEAQQLRERGAA